MEMLPVRGPNESAERFLDRLIPWMTRNLVAPQPAETATIVDGQGRVIVSPLGNFSYVGERLVVAPDIVKIDTTDLVDGAVELAKTNIPQLVLGDKVITGNEVVLSLLAGDVVAVKAKIDNLEVNDANVANLDAGKLTTGYLDADRVAVGSIGDMASNYNGAGFDFTASGAGTWNTWIESPPIVGDGTRKFLVIATCAFGLGNTSIDNATLQMRLRNSAGVLVTGANVAVAVPTSGAYGTAVLTWVAQPTGVEYYYPEACWLGATPTFASVQNRFCGYVRLAR